MPPDAAEPWRRELDPALTQLRAAAPARDYEAQLHLLQQCRQTLGGCGEAWVEATAAPRGLGADSPLRAQEWANGPVAVARLLACLEATFTDLARGALPALPPLAAAGLERLSLPPVAGLADRLLFRGYSAAVMMAPDTAQQQPPLDGGTAVVLGAGNVSSMPVCDALHHVFLGGARVLLKLSPMHEALLGVLQTALRPLLDQGRLRLCVGGADLGRAAATDARTDAVHLTGSRQTAERLFAEPLLRHKRCSSELGNVTPVLLLPGDYPLRELQFQARRLAGIVADNAGCNCVTPRVLLTAAGWPQRQQFLLLLETAMAALPPRPPFYAEAARCFETAAERPLSADGLLRPLLRRDVDPRRSPAPFAAEQFAPVLLEVPLQTATTAAFIDAAAGFANDVCAGTLACHLMAPGAALQADAGMLRAALQRLHYGTVAINVWAAFAYALMTPPWGAAPPRDGDALGSGSGHVHGTLLLQRVRKVVVQGPALPWPRPPWLPGHRRATATFRRLFSFYCAPRPLRLLAVLAQGLRP